MTFGRTDMKRFTYGLAALLFIGLGTCTCARAAAAADGDGAAARDQTVAKARALLSQGRHAEALALLKQIAADHPNSPTASLAHLTMAEAYQKTGDEEKMVACWKKAATFRPSDTDPRIRTADRSASIAQERLAGYYMKRNDWPEAVKWWEAWQPVGWCGTGLAASHAHRTCKIAVCKMKMGREDEGMEMLEQAILTRQYECSGSMDIPLLLVDTHHRRGTLNEVETKLKPLADPRKNAGAAVAIEYMRMLRMAESKDVAGLWKSLDFGSHPYPGDDWKSVKLTAFLVSLGDAARPFLMDRVREKIRSGRLWAFVILARMKAVEITPLLRERIKAEPNVHILKDYFYALALLGTDEARAVIEHHAREGTGNHQMAAQQILNAFPKR